MNRLSLRLWSDTEINKSVTLEWHFKKGWVWFKASNNKSNKWNHLKLHFFWFSLSFTWMDKD